MLATKLPSFIVNLQHILRQDKPYFEKPGFGCDVSLQEKTQPAAIIAGIWNCASKYKLIFKKAYGTMKKMNEG